MGPNRFIHLMFIAGAVVMAYLFAKSGEWALGYVMAKPPETLIAVGAVVVGSVGAFVLYRNDRVFELAAEVTNELRKVTWPSRKETMITTAMVFVMVAVASVLFLVADQIIRLFIPFILGVAG